MPFIPLLPTPLLTWILFLVAIFLLLGVSEWISARIGMRPENSRQLVHVIVGIFIFLSRFIFQEPFYPLVTGLLFVGVNLATLTMGRFKSMHATDRVSYGTIYYPLAYVLIVALFWHRDPVALLIAILLMAFADPLAAWVGERYGRRPFTLWHDPKTPAGTAAMFLGSALLSTLGLIILIPLNGDPAPAWSWLLLAVILLAVLATIAEIQSNKGSDNITIPLTAALFVFLLRALPPDWMLSFILWIMGSALLLGLAARLRALAPSGALTAWAMGTLIFMAGGWHWVLPIVAFFILSSILTRINPGGEVKPANPRSHAGRRNLIQVFANGGFPLVIAAAYGLWHSDLLYLAFLAALAAATADTWGTEIGGWQQRPPRNIISWQPVTKGDSGAISLAGTLGTLAGAAALAALGWWLQPQLIDLHHWLALTAIGFLAATIDSVLGATVQVRYRLLDTGRIVEKQPAIDQDSVVHSGWQWLDNNMVNLVCTGSGAALGLLWLIT
ncbi:MAG: DUF92 domain-containing protein [Fidelibacterota bacterium]|nr:MAG: DUF92 domain-containing protein [Candidatus Neomarinimicrobiota bacterium]